MITKFWRISLIPIGKTHTHTHTYIHIFIFSKLELSGSLLLKAVVPLFFFFSL